MSSTDSAARRGTRYSAVGLISGTSMDGVDAALVTMDDDALHPAVSLIEFVSRAYPDELRDALADLAGGAQVTAEEIAALHTSVAVAFSGAFFDVCRQGKVSPSDVDFIGSHGQTVAHIPPGSGAEVAGTLQLGPPTMIAALTGVTAIGDFRSGDVAIGGQGAPLAPYCDYLLRRSDDESRVILNLGGIANVTYLPRGARREDVLAFDVGPANMVSDILFRALFSGSGSFDEDGMRAAVGVVSAEVRDIMYRHPFFAAAPPKSAGHREFGPAFAWTLKTTAEAHGLSREDTLATAIALSVHAIADAVARFLPGGVDAVFATGGGARNRTLMSGLAEALPGVSVRPIDELGIPAEAKEAVDFALLGREALLGRPNVIRAVTGAARELVLGTIARG